MPEPDKTLDLDRLLAAVEREPDSRVRRWLLALLRDGDRSSFTVPRPAPSRNEDAADA